MIIFNNYVPLYIDREGYFSTRQSFGQEYIDTLGSITINGETWRTKQLLKKSYMVMQDVNHQLFCETVADEVRLGRY